MEHLLLHCSQRYLVIFVGVIWTVLGHAEDSGANANLLKREFSKSEILKPGMRFHCASCG